VEGTNVGVVVGAEEVGVVVGVLVGELAVGRDVGRDVVGWFEGDVVGCEVEGTVVGVEDVGPVLGAPNVGVVGALEGVDEVGDNEGEIVGETDGDDELGVSDGDTVGVDNVGELEGATVGTDVDGVKVGDVDGDNVVGVKVVGQRAVSLMNRFKDQKYLDGTPWLERIFVDTGATPQAVLFKVYPSLLTGAGPCWPVYDMQYQHSGKRSSKTDKASTVFQPVGPVETSEIMFHFEAGFVLSHRSSKLPIKTSFVSKPLIPNIAGKLGSMKEIDLATARSPNAVCGTT
jgi:hypothetical protein